MPVRVDWQGLRDVVNENGASIDAPFLFVLPHGGRHLLMSIMDILRYRATYRIEDYDYSDWDELQAIVEATHFGLMDGEQVQNISESITYLADTLAANLTGLNMEELDMNQVVNVCCGGCTSCNQSAAGGLPDVYAPVVDPISDDWQESNNPPGANVSEAEKCSYANYLIYTLRLALLRASEMDGNIDEYNDYLSSLYSFLGIGGNASLAIDYKLGYEAYVWVLSRINGSSSAVGYIAEMFDQYYDMYVCALFGSSGETDARDTLHQTIDATVPDLVVASAAKNIADALPYQLLFVNSGQYPIPPGFENRACCGHTDFADSPLPSSPAGYYWRIAEPRNYSLGGGVTFNNHGDGTATFNVPVSGNDRFWEPMNANTHDEPGVVLSALVALEQANYYNIFAGSQFDAGTTVQAEPLAVFVADLGAPSIDWGDKAVYTADNPSVQRISRMQCYAAGGVFRYAWYELVAE